MMTVKEYAEDVQKTINYVMNLCKSLNINVSDENSDLSEDDIILLDSNLSVEDEENYDDEILDDDELEKDYKLEQTTNKSEIKMKRKVVIKKDDNSKYQKAKKEAYKNKEKLEKNKIDDSIVLYKEGMNVKDLADAIGTPVKDIIKKLFDLGVLTNINQTLDFTSAEIIAADYKKVLKKQEALAMAEGEDFSLALGKKGQNVKLASRLTKYKIDVKTPEQVKEMGISIKVGE